MADETIARDFEAQHGSGQGRGEADRMVEGSDGSGLGDDEMMDDGM